VDDWTAIYQQKTPETIQGVADPLPLGANRTTQL